MVRADEAIEWIGLLGHRLGQRKGRPGAASSMVTPLAYFLRASAAARAASFTSPAASWADPLALSIFPSVSISLSPVSLPAPSLMAPFALSAAPFTCSRSMSDVPLLSTLRDNERAAHGFLGGHY